MTNLSEAIAVALEGPETDPAAIADLIHAAGNAAMMLQAEQAEIDQAAFATETPDHELPRLRERKADLHHRFLRLTRSLERLKDLHEQAEKRRADAQHLERRARVLEQRDQVAAELKQEYPRIAAEMASLLQRVEAAERACASFGVPGVEATVRGLTPHDVCRITTAVILPALNLHEHKRGRSIWPVRTEHNVPVPTSTLGSEAQQTMHVNEARRREEQGSSTRRLLA